MRISKPKEINSYLTPSKNLKILLIENRISIRKISKLTGIERNRIGRIYDKKKPAQLNLYEAFLIGEILTPENPLDTISYLLGINPNISNQLYIPE